MPGWYDMRFQERPAAVRVDCEVCARAMYMPPSRIHNNRTCGGPCAVERRKRQHAALVRPCETCGEQFRPRPTQVASGTGRFCSQRCNTAGRAALHTPEARERARIGWRQAVDDGRIQFRSGPDSPSWLGGEEAQRARRKTPEARAADAARLRDYRKRYPHKAHEFSKRRSGRKLGRLEYGSIPRIGKAQKWKCAICQVPIKDGYHVDHIQPLAKGGEHAARNIQLLCATCNVRKNARDPMDYMRSLGRLL